MKRPSFQFYPGDWQANSNLRRCTHAEKGVWLDVMCLMHDQPEYGVLRWPLKEIAQAVGAPIGSLRALVTKSILKGDDIELVEAFVYIPRSGRKDGDPVTLLAPQAGPVWYSSRMVKDEYVRTIRGESSRFGGDEDDASKDAPKPPLGDGSSSSSSSSSSTKPLALAGFARFWDAWPAHKRKSAKPQCEANWRTQGCEAITDTIVAAVERAKVDDDWRKSGGAFIPAPLVWLRQRRWEAAANDGGVDDIFAGAR